MLFVYWLERIEPYSTRLDEIFVRMRVRGDRLYTSCLTLGELLAGGQSIGNAAHARGIHQFMLGPDVILLDLDRAAAEHFGTIRASAKVKPADAIHLACAASHGTDLFLTNDRALHRLIIPGIQFIAGIDTTVFGAP